MVVYDQELSHRNASERCFGQRKDFRIAHDICRNLKDVFEDSLMETACGLHNLRIDFPIEAWLKAA